MPGYVEKIPSRIEYRFNVDGLVNVAPEHYAALVLEELKRAYGNTVREIEVMQDKFTSMRFPGGSDDNATVIGECAMAAWERACEEE